MHLTVGVPQTGSCTPPAAEAQRSPDGRRERVRSVVQVPPGIDPAVQVPAGYRLTTAQCLSCWRDFRIFVAPDDRTGSILVIGVPCPHCGRWEAETIVPPVSRPVFVQACTRTWLGWQIRGARRRLAIARAYARMWVEWPYWAVVRLIHRVSRARARGGGGA